MLWGRPYKWEKYSLNKLEFLAGITPFAPASEVIEYYPDYHDFEVRREGSSENLYGRRKPTSSNKVGVVKSPYQTAYPKDGISGDYYYKLIA